MRSALIVLILLLLTQICSGSIDAGAASTAFYPDLGDYSSTCRWPDHIPASKEAVPASLIQRISPGDLKALKKLSIGSGAMQGCTPMSGYSAMPGYSVAEYGDMMDLSSWRSEREEIEGDRGSLSIIRIDPSLFPKIMVYLLVRQGCPSEALTARNFAIKENSTGQAVGRLFSTGREENQSLDLAVVFDDTKSMEYQIDGMKAGVQGLINQIDSVGLDTRYSLVTFKDGVTVRCNWTNDTTEFNNAIGSLYASGGDEIHEDTLDATEAALSMGFRNETIRAVIVVTDAPSHEKGDGTNISNYTRDEVKSDLIRSDVMFISVSPDFSSSPETVDLRYLAEDAGGAWIDIQSSNFSAILDQILSILTQTYSIEYWTSDLSPNTTREVFVDARSPCLMTRDSENYTSPKDLSDEENLLLVYEPGEDED